MCQVRYQKDGVGRNYLDKDLNLDIAKAIELFSDYKIQFIGKNSIVGNQSNVSEYAANRHVVLHVMEGEAKLPFDKPGYYLICDLSIETANSILGI